MYGNDLFILSNRVCVFVCVFLCMLVFVCVCVRMCVFMLVCVCVASHRVPLCFDGLSCNQTKHPWLLVVTEASEMKRNTSIIHCVCVRVCVCV